MNSANMTGKTPKGSDLWPMGAVTRRTGITEHTLRAWERRFGFPEPLRLPSGHRRFTSDQVRQLLLINRALGCGYRAGDVVPLPQERIEALLRESGGESAETESREFSQKWIQGILVDAKNFDEASVMSKLGSDAATLGVARFLRERAAPLMEELGAAWARGDIGIRHEHFVSEILEDRLRALRLPLETSATGRPVVLACLPDELHSLGLQMVALEIAAAGRQNLILGPHTPIEEIVATAESLGAAAVGISVSAFAVNQATKERTDLLAKRLPADTLLWVGGKGAENLERLPKEVRRFVTLDDVADAVRVLPD